MSIKRYRIAALGIALLLGGSVGAYAGGWFLGIGDLPGGWEASEAFGISADGTTIVGVGNLHIGSGTGDAFAWTLATGMVQLGDLGGTFADTQAFGCSADGSMIVGYSQSPESIPYTEACRWPGSLVADGLGDLSGGTFNSRAAGVSGDGSVIVGRGTSGSATEAVRWVGGNPQALTGFPTDQPHREARGVSGDGNVIVGFSMGAGTTAYRWRPGYGRQPLGDLPGGSTYSDAYAASYDGGVIVGRSSSSAGMEAFRWTQSGGMVGLGGLADDPYSVAYAVSGDGSVIVGHSTSDEYYGEAFIWDAEHGMRPLADVLADDYGFDVVGWQLREACGISADGLTICGWGINPGAQHEAWVVRIPEATGVCLLLVTMLLLRRR
jgi:uncharacterized membrane protein